MKQLAREIHFHHCKSWLEIQKETLLESYFKERCLSICQISCLTKTTNKRQPGRFLSATTKDII